MKRLIAGILFISLCFIYWHSRSVKKGPGVLVPDAPKITSVAFHSPFGYKEYTLTPRKKFEGQMRILDKKRYFFDSLTEIAPYDFIGGWGDYSDEQNFRHVYVSILQRKPNIEISKSDISRRKITSNTVFFHAIPATPEIEGALSNMRVGHIARIKGVLVDVASENGLFYGTSLLSDSKPDTKAAMLFIEEVSFW